RPAWPRPTNSPPRSPGTTGSTRSARTCSTWPATPPRPAPPTRPPLGTRPTPRRSVTSTGRVGKFAVADRRTTGASGTGTGQRQDGIFKSDYTVLEDGCTVGTGALVHYDVTMGQGSQ